MRFAEALDRCVRKIPRGRVASCGQVAQALGDIRAARAVASWILAHPDTGASYRVVRADGRPLSENAEKRLRRVGIPLLRGCVRRRRFVESLPRVGFLEELREEQVRLSAAVSEHDETAQIQLIAGVDVAYAGDRAFVAAVVCEPETLNPVEIVKVRMETQFPYIPTYLAYREFPAIASALARTRHRPDVILIDGHGRLHPALFGIACYVGIRLNVATIGVAKSHLVGKPATVQGFPRYTVPIEFAGRVLGYAWTPPNASKPIFISVGHRISLETALSVVRRVTRTRIPEPLRLADGIAKRMKRGEKV